MDHTMLAEGTTGEPLITVTDPGRLLPMPWGPALVLAFHDAVTQDRGVILASQADLTAVQVYLLGCSGRVITVSAPAHFSRSAAVAAFVLHLFEPHLEDQQIVEVVRQVAPGCVPNRRVLNLIDRRTFRDLSTRFFQS